MRKLACFALPFAGAVVLAVYLLPAGALLPAGLCCAAAALAALPLRGEGRLRVVLTALGLAAGLLWTGGYGAVMLAPARALDGATASAAATVTDWPQPTDYGCAVLARLETEGPDQRVWLRLRGEVPELRPGDRIAFTASFRLADTMAGEETDYYLARGITLLANGGGELTVERPGRVGPLYWPAYVSRALKDSVDRVFPSSAAPLVTALLTGDKSGLEGGFYAALQRTGVAHVVAVSGMHVSFLAGLVTTLLGRRRRLSALVGIILLFCFAAVAGNTPSVLRAAFMQSMLLLAPLLGREDDRLTSLSAVLLLLLLANPYAAASVSLQLSFAAVAGIYLLTGPLYRRWTARLPARPKGFWIGLGCRAARVLLGTLATSLGAIAFTTPLTACYFNMVSLISPLANLLTLWAVSDAFLGGLLTALLGLVLPGAAALAGLVVSLPVWYLQWLVPRLARLPFAAVAMRSVYLWLWLLLVYAVLLLYLLRRGEKRRPLVPIGVCGISLCAALVLNAAGMAGGRLSVSVLDVGQGLSVALSSGGRTVLVDCGGNSAAAATAAGCFQGMGTSRLDLLILTHCHSDHASGVPELLERMEVGLLVLPDLAEEDPLRGEITALAAEKGTPVVCLSENAQVTLGEAVFTIYAPLGDGGANEEGLSVLCTAGDFDALITGDMNAAVERRLVKYGALPDIELLVAGHHGSQYATSEELLLATRPEYAVISVGDNRYGHPAPETLERLAAAGCQIYRTDWMGTVTITAQ